MLVLQCASANTGSPLFEKVCFNFRNLVNSNLHTEYTIRRCQQGCWQCFFEVCFSPLLEKKDPLLVQLVGTSNLVDPASSHTLVSKIKPCMSKYKQSIL